MFKCLNRQSHVEKLSVRECVLTLPCSIFRAQTYDSDVLRRVYQTS